MDPGRSRRARPGPSADVAARGRRPVRVIVAEAVESVAEAVAEREQEWWIH